ncbi:DUF4114 domain-containing protein [Massilia sp. W12]|uniref:DUF4114 domain-containing protein n=1 Tax=Massilia sp. W12 TaxID=3126507 RepID=UPI0030CEE72B
MSFKKFALAAVFAAATLNAHAAIEIVGGRLIVADTGDVNVTFLGSDAGYTDVVFFENDGRKLFTGHSTPVGSSINLGSFARGTELTFRMHVSNTGDNFFTGPASANPDNLIHAHASLDDNGNAVLGFEDILGGGDRDYNDIQLRVSNVAAPVPEAETWGLMLAGLGGLGLIARRKKAEKLA